MQTSQMFFGGRFKRIAMGACAVLILTAVPAAALTWTNTWTTGHGAAGAITVTATNDTAGAVGPSVLTIDFGASGAGKFKTTRLFTLGAGESRLRVIKSLNTTVLDNGDVSVKVKTKSGKITVSGKVNGTREQNASPSTVTISGAA